MDCSSRRMFEQIELFMEFFSDTIELAKFVPFFKIDDELCFRLNLLSSHRSSNLTLFVLRLVMGSGTSNDFFKMFILECLSSLILGFIATVLLVLWLLVR